MSLPIEGIAEALHEKQQVHEARKPETRRIMKLLRKFLKNSGNIVYGGAAINANLPPEDKIYNYNKVVPDFDVFSPRPTEDVRAAADFFARHGYREVEAKRGVHPGTFKLFVSYMPTLDVTYMPAALYDVVPTVTQDGIRYAAPEWLRIDLFKELAMPRGDVTRYPKVYKRLQLLLKHHPLCAATDKLTDQDTRIKLTPALKRAVQVTDEYVRAKKLPLLGATALTQAYMLGKRADAGSTVDTLGLSSLFDALAMKPLKNAQRLARMLPDATVRVYKGTGEVVPYRASVWVTSGDGEHQVPLIDFWQPVAGCYAYHDNVNGYRVATIWVILALHNASLFDPGLTSEQRSLLQAKIECVMASLLQRARVDKALQKELANPFSDTCFGTSKNKADYLRETAKLPRFRYVPKPK